MRLRPQGTGLSNFTYSRSVQLLPPSVLAQLWLSDVFTCTRIVPAIMLTIVPLALSPSLIVSQVWPPSREWIREAWLPPAHTSFPRAFTTENSMALLATG